MKTRSVIIAVASLLMAYQARAQVLTTGEPATATKAKYVLPSDPKSMTVADEGASRGYIIGKRVDPDKKKPVQATGNAPAVHPAKKTTDSSMGNAATMKPVSTSSTSRKVRSTTHKSRTTRKPNQ